MVSLGGSPASRCTAAVAATCCSGSIALPAGVGGPYPCLGPVPCLLPPHLHHLHHLHLVSVVQSIELSPALLWLTLRACCNASTPDAAIRRQLQFYSVYPVGRPSTLINSDASSMAN